MSKERKIHGYQRTLRLETPKKQRTGRPGRIIHGGPYTLPHNPDALHLIPLFSDVDLGSNPMSPSAASDFWKKDFEEATKAEGKEAAWLNYSGTYFDQADEATRTVKEMKTKIEAGEPIEGDEKFYTDPEFFRQKLLSDELTSEDLYKLFLIATRMDIISPEKREQFDSAGFSLGEKADRSSRGYPRYKLANWKEHERKMEERRIRNEKEAAEQEEKDPNVRTFHRYNAPEVYEPFTAHYYLSQIKRWEDLIDSMVNRSEISWPLFRTQYLKFVGIAGKLRDTRNYEGNKIKYRPIDYDEMIKNKDPEAILKGLAALYTARKGEERACEPKGLKLLEIAAQLPSPEIIYKPPQPWNVFVPYVLVSELYRLLGETKTVSKPQAKRRRFNDIMFRVLGSEPEVLRNIKPLNYEKSRGDDEIPF